MKAGCPSRKLENISPVKNKSKYNGVVTSYLCQFRTGKEVMGNGL